MEHKLPIYRKATYDFFETNNKDSRHSGSRGTATVWISLPGETAVLTCFDAEYMCLTNGIFFINHSPTQKTVEPTQEDTNIPTRSINTREVKNPRPEILSNTLVMKKELKKEIVYAR
jgi:hypothetical protein